MLRSEVKESIIMRWGGGWGGLSKWVYESTSDGSVGRAEALSKFAESCAKIEAMKIEIQKEML